MECGIAVRLPIVRVAGRAKQYATGKTGGRSDATDAMSEGRRQVDVDFVITGVVLISISRQWWVVAQPRGGRGYRVNKVVVKSDISGQRRDEARPLRRQNS